MADESPPSSTLKVKNERLKIYAGVITLAITSVVTVVTSMSAYTREEKESTAKAAYKELSAEMTVIAHDQIQIAKDLSNLRGYLAGIAQKGGLAAPVETSAISFGGGSQRLAAVGRLTVRPPPADAPPAKPHEMPPMIAARPKEYEPPKVDDLAP